MLEEQWNAIEAQYHIVDTVERCGRCDLGAQDIANMRKIRPDLKFEPRLLTHFDNSLQQPELFRRNKLSIMPVKRGSYVIGHFSPFANDMDYNNLDVKHVNPLPQWVSSAKTEYRFNEAMGISYSHASGILSDFVGENELIATVSGRHSGGRFDYGIKSSDEIITFVLITRRLRLTAVMRVESLSYLLRRRIKPLRNSLCGSCISRFGLGESVSENLWFGKRIPDYVSREGFHRIKSTRASFDVHQESHGKNSV